MNLNKKQKETLEWQLVDVERRSTKDPLKFQIPSRKLREACVKGNIVKLIFTTKNTGSKSDSIQGERMWVIINEVQGLRYKGILDNEPMIIKHLLAGDVVTFHPENIADIYDQ